jgi:hypothetical protein
VGARFSLLFFFLFLVICLNEDCTNPWVVDVIRFFALGLKRMSFSMDFLLPEPRKIIYLCIELKFGIDMMLQLKINHD